MNTRREYPKLKPAASVEIGCTSFPVTALPEPVILYDTLGIAGVSVLDGSVVHRADTRLFEVRGTITPKGDYLVMFPAGFHYAYREITSAIKINRMLSYRSPDRGKTWIGPAEIFNIDYNQHGFIPLVPQGSNRIYCFGTQPVWDKYRKEKGQHENAPIGFFYSDDDGYSWDGPHLIEPENDPGFLGMSVTRMCETGEGTWILGSHTADWSLSPLVTNQYILRSEDKGRSWNLLPDKRPHGWHVGKFNRMDEGRALNLGKGHVLFMIRTPAGHLWLTRSKDDGKTWSEPEPTPLVHPDAPPMIELLSDKKTLVCLHHNRHHDLDYTGLSGGKEIQMKDRGEVWVSLSHDFGETWDEPKFLFCNALEANLEEPFYNYQCSYLDMLIDGTTLNIFVPHRWQQVLHLQIEEGELCKLPVKSRLLGS